MIKHDPQNIFYYSTKINDAQFFSGFGTKKLILTKDSSSVKKLCNDLGVQLDGVYRSNQTHSTAVKVIRDKKTPSTDEDGSITTEKHIALVVKTADCVPIIYIDKKAGVIGISHQGWRGTYDEMTKKMISEMIKNGSNRKDLQVAIGPAIGLCCFEVQGDVFLKFKTKFAHLKGTTVQEREGKLFLNLLEINFKLLQEAGLHKEQIDYLPFCTFCNKDKFFSYRREYHTNFEQFSEQLSFIIVQ